MALLITKANLSRSELDALSRDAAYSAGPVIYSVENAPSCFPQIFWMAMDCHEAACHEVTTKSTTDSISIQQGRVGEPDRIGMPKTLYDVN